MSEPESKILAEEFAIFWLAYPVHIGRLAALKAFAKARKSADVADILRGIDRYIAHKPAWKAFAHASSWLNGQRWTDEFTEPGRRRTPAFECPHAPRCGGRNECYVKTSLETARRRS